MTDSQTNATATHVSTDRHPQPPRVIYWFALSGIERETGWEFQGSEEYGIYEHGSKFSILDCDGCPMTEGDRETIAVRNLITITDDMRIKEQ